MHATCSKHPISLEFITPIKFGANYKAPHYVILCFLLLWYFSSTHIFSSVPCSQTSLFFAHPLEWLNIIRDRKTRYSKLNGSKNCLNVMYIQEERNVLNKDAWYQNGMIIFQFYWETIETLLNLNKMETTRVFFFLQLKYVCISLIMFPHSTAQRYSCNKGFMMQKCN
jgi:hypothetical protein